MQGDLNVLSPEEEQSLQKTMHRLAERVREGGAHLLLRLWDGVYLLDKTIEGKLVPYFVNMIYTPA